MFETNAHIIAFHGWGFDSSFWRPLGNLMGEGTRFEAADRGYFSSPETFSFHDHGDQKKVIFTHSFGLHWCPDELLNSADELIVFGGFLDFHPDTEQQFRRSKFLLRQMTSQFVDKPERVLNQFYNNCYHPFKNAEYQKMKRLNHDLLLNDLSLIDHDQHSKQRFFDMKAITILHGSDDRIVSRDIARQMYRSLRFNSQYFEILGAGHAFPVTHADKCTEILQSTLNPA